MGFTHPTLLMRHSGRMLGFAALCANLQFLEPDEL